MSIPSRSIPVSAEVHAVIDEALPRLLAYAARRLRRVGWVEGVDQLPSAMQAEEVVAGAVVLYLSGTRACPGTVDVVTFLCGVIRSLVYHAKHDGAAGRVTPIEDAPELMAPSSRRDEGIDRRRLLSAVTEVVAADPETEGLFEAMRRGAGTRAEQAAALGWTPERVKAVHVRMNRRLDAAGLSYGDDDDERRDRSPRAAQAPRGCARRRAAG